MTKKTLAEWWEETYGSSAKQAEEGDAAYDEVEALYAKLGKEPAVDASVEVIRKEMAAVYRDMRSGRIDCNDGTRLAYVLDLLRKSHESTVVKDRLGILEKAVGVKPDNGGPDWLGLPFGDAGPE
ncbi:hypothetical protein [Methylococcus sp. EFPC2]|uniref:hypothetical protein n=1 Tax=Methylococcus sp. EFPC2 TaxID=2812648 RepID=UPI0019678996|nr:hypothetical protein [Methylococcus sp. EFPC2]QSA95712.1 hypothetical protein JWZ97_10675 [Methylococcus sp. EFPC2]